MTDADLVEPTRPEPSGSDSGPPDADRELDVLVVGGGPAGTATAFRAVEHGLSVQVIDFDDLMRRIRDYSKDKLILPGFGGGDRMAFPRGGPLISALAFEPIDKDEMCARWKALYREHRVPTRTGVELTGLEPRRGELVARLSGGNQQRVNIAIGLLAEPAVLLLDEPSVGLDPRQRARLWQFIGALAGRGTSVVFSTHDIQEAERYGRRLLVLADGESLFDGSADELRDAVGEEAPGAAGGDFETAFVAFLQHRGH